MNLAADLGPIWQALHGVEAVAPDDDNDDDGATNREEFVAGTNPLDPADRFAMSSIQIKPEGTLLRWNAVNDGNYAVEYRENAQEAWITALNPTKRSGGQQEFLVESTGSGQGEFRLAFHPQTAAEEAALEALGEHDTDDDGQADVVEYLAGTHPFDPESKFEISEVLAGPFIKLEWSGIEGKTYQIQYSPDLIEDYWEAAGGTRQGVTETMNAIFSLAEVPGQFFRILVNDTPSEIEGLTEWEANRLGLDPLERNEFQRNGLDIEAFLSRPDIIEVETPEPVANITQQETGMVEIRRIQGVQELSLAYSVSGTAVPGTDYEALPGELVIPFGMKSVFLPITPLPAYQGSEAKSVILTFDIPEGDGDETVAKAVTVNLIRESAISVIDYGTVGDGVTDDTAAIQAAIVALENSATQNTLWFPAGTYRLSQLTTQPFTSGNYYRTLFLGSMDLSGRDLVFAGEPGSILLSKTGMARSHILLTRARWRSLSFHNLTFEKDSQPLRLVQAGSEPNGAYGVAVAEYYGLSPESLAFKNCRFLNCHGAIRTFATGSNIWGNLNQFSMIGCEVLNPYGSNTVEGNAAYGGGQQINLTPWVGNAIYRNNLFVGGPDVVPDTALNPGGVPKDGSHFGSPQRLDFSENIVRNMGVEAVFPTSDPRIGYLASPFQIPPANTGQTVEVSIVSDSSVLSVDQSINIRAWVNNTNRNCILIIRNVDRAGDSITLENIGQSSETIDGFTLPKNAPIYLQNKHPCEASVTNNIISSNNGRGGMGIASNSKVHIANNFIQNYGIGINFYPEVRDILGKPEKDSIAENNIIVWNLSATAMYFLYGIQSWGTEVTIMNNFVQAGSASKCFGIVARGDSEVIRGNQVSTVQAINNGYSSTIRAVGIGIGNSAKNSYSSRNSSRGFDVGMGPAQPFQSIPYQLEDHFSFDDILAVDPRGITLQD